MTSPGGQSVGRVTVTVAPDTSDFRKKLRTQLESKTQGVEAEIPVKLDASTLRAQVRMLQQQLKQLGSVKIPTRNFGNTFSSLARSASSAGSTATSAFRGMGRAASSMIGTIGKAAVVVTGLAAALGTVQSVVGGVAAGVAGLPVVISSLAGPVAAIALGFEGIKDAAKSLEGPFNRLRNSLSATFRDVMTPVFRELRGIFPTLETGLNGVARAVGGFASELVGVLTSKQGLREIEDMFQGIQTTLERITPSVAGFVRESLKIAGSTELYKILGNTISGVTDQFSSFLRKVRETGLLRDTLSALKPVLVSIANLFTSWATEGMRFVKNAAPGIKNFIDGLTNFLNDFDWARMGRVFGNVFGQIGKSLSNMPTGAVRTLEHVFYKLLEVMAKVYNAFIDVGQALDVIPDNSNNLKINLQELRDTFLDSGKSARELAISLQKFSPSFNTLSHMSREFAVNVLDNFKKMTYGGRDLLTEMSKLMKFYGVESKQNFLREIERVAPGIVNAKGEITGSAREVAIAAGLAFERLKAGSIGRSKGREFAGGIRGARNLAASAADSVSDAANWALNSVNSYGSGQSIGRDFAAGIRSAYRSVFNAAQSIANAASAVLPQSPAERGPFSGSGWTPYRGRALVAGFAQGIAGSKHLAGTAADDMIREVDKSISGYARGGGLSADIKAAVSSDDYGGVEDRIAAAMEGWEVRLDGNGITKMVNKNNQRNKRR